MNLPSMPGANESGQTPLPTFLLDAVYDPGSPVNASAAVLWTYLYRRHTEAGVPSFYTTLAVETGQAKTTVRRLVQALKDAGAIRVLHSEVGGRQMTEYVLAAEAPLERSPMLSTSGWAYAISGPTRQRVKIGHSRRPQKRLLDLQSGSAEPLEVVWQADGGAALERHLHDHFASRRLHGEWFDFTGDDAVALITSAAQSFGRTGGTR